MDALKIIEHDGVRVLTTQQLADAYGVDAIAITKNYNNNKDRYVLGKHYLCLEGDELRDFKGNIQNLDVAPNLNKLYLWTEKGCFLAAKSLNTDQAWEAYDKLIDGYFTIKQAIVDRSQLSPQMQMLYGLIEQQAKQELEQKRQAERIERIEQKADALCEAFEPIHPDTWRKDITLKFNRIQKRSQIPWNELYVEMYKELDRRAGADTAIRLKNRRDRMRRDGISESDIKRCTRMDVIQDDKKLRLIFEQIIREYEVKYC